MSKAKLPLVVFEKTRGKDEFTVRLLSKGGSGNSWNLPLLTVTDRTTALGLRNRIENAFADVPLEHIVVFK